MDQRIAQPDTEQRKLNLAIARLDEQLLTKPDDVRLLELRAKASERLARWEDAAGFWQRVVKSARTANERAVEARACLQAGICLSRSNQPTKSLGFLQRAVAAYELLRDAPMTAKARVEQARHHVSQGDDAKLRPLLELAIPPLEAGQCWDDLGWACFQLSRVLAAAGTTEAALDAARNAVEATVKAKDGRAVGARLVHLGGLHSAAGTPGKARSYYERALPYLRANRARRQLLTTYAHLVDIAREEADPDSEERWLTEAAFVVDPTNDLAAQARYRVELSGLVAVRSVPRGRHLAQQAIERFHRSGDPHGAAMAYRALGTIVAATDPVAARDAWTRALDLYRMVGDDAGATSVSDLLAASTA